MHFEETCAIYDSALKATESTLLTHFQEKGGAYDQALLASAYKDFLAATEAIPSAPSTPKQQLDNNLFILEYCLHQFSWAFRVRVYKVTRLRC